MLYLDTSALAKVYLSEPDSPSISGAIQASNSSLVTSRITYAEMLSVLNRCLSAHRFSLATYKAQKKAFLEDWNEIHVVELTDDVLSNAERLIERHRLRGLDAIHLCSALWIGWPSFACYDHQLRNAAAAEGLSVAP